jgi:hypothetical protein
MEPHRSMLLLDNPVGLNPEPPILSIYGRDEVEIY